MLPQQPLKIFVAMPGTKMGANALYDNPESVKANLLEPVAEKLRAKLGREVDLVIEKDKTEVGVIHPDMFNEARDADVYIADITGANPNVYLELGVRWSLRDNVTIPIVQSTDDIKFNVAGNRALTYNPNTIIKSIDNIVEAILKGLKNSKCDSPVRLNGELITISQNRLDELLSENERLKKARGEDFYLAALVAGNDEDRISLLERALLANPSSVEVLIELGITYRRGGTIEEYNKAIEKLEIAARLDSGNSIARRELGVTYSKQGNPQSAANELKEAVRLDPKDAEAWSNLGGALRRLGMSRAPQYDLKALEEARDSYVMAHGIKERKDLYSGLNVAAMNVLLSKWNSELLAEAKKGFSRQILLCRFDVQERPDDFWAQFNLANALLFSDDFEGAHAAFEEGVNMIPQGSRLDTVRSVLGPLRDYLTAQVLEGELLSQVEKTVNFLESVTD